MYRWLDLRMDISGVWRATFLHPVPIDVNWWYVLGSATLTAFIVQVVTGVALAFAYVPSTEHAYSSLDFITRQAFLGSVRAGTPPAVTVRDGARATLACLAMLESARTLEPRPIDVGALFD